MKELSNIPYTPDMIGSGQFSICVNCGLDHIIDGCEIYDGCLGKLSGGNIMNACCGHGDNEQAYIQYADSSCIRGEAAVELQRILKLSVKRNV